MHGVGDRGSRLWVVDHHTALVVDDLVDELVAAGRRLGSTTLVGLRLLLWLPRGVVDVLCVEVEVRAVGRLGLLLRGRILLLFGTGGAGVGSSHF